MFLKVVSRTISISWMKILRKKGFNQLFPSSEVGLDDNIFWQIWEASVEVFLNLVSGANI